MLNNKYIIFKFEYTFYNYSSKKNIIDFEYIKAKSIDEAESIFWELMNGRNVRIKKVLSKIYLRVYRTYNKSPRFNYSFTQESYAYLDDGKTRIIQ